MNLYMMAMYIVVFAVFVHIFFTGCFMQKIISALGAVGCIMAIGKMMCLFF